MNWLESLAFLMGGITVLMFLGIPVAIAFLALNIIGAFLFMGGAAGLDQIARNTMLSVSSFSLAPIPLFVMMGEVLFQSGLAFKVIEGIERLILRLPGRLAVVSVVSGTVFSAISGSTIATTAMLGSAMTPTMLARGYHPSLAMGPVIAIGGVDMLIPPSGLAVLLGSLAGISISGLLIAGVVPGILLAILFVCYIVVRVRMNPLLAPADDDVPLQGWERYRLFFVYVLPLISIFAVVVGSMASGIATPTESAALGALATIIFALLYRALSLKILVSSVQSTLAVSGMVLFIIVGATGFAQMLGFSGASDGLLKIIISQGFSPFTVVIAMLIILLLLGSFVDQVSMMLLTLPFFMPLVIGMKIDPIWFGVLFLFTMQIGLMSPPFGLLTITMKSVVPRHLTMWQVYLSAIPYVTIVFLMMVAILFFPAIVTWLPNLIE
jgi:tripartite ATP-independent transporter DctM subunit